MFLQKATSLLKTIMFARAGATADAISLISAGTLRFFPAMRPASDIRRWQAVVYSTQQTLSVADGMFA